MKTKLEVKMRKLSFILLFAVVSSIYSQSLENLKGGVNTFGFQPNMGQVGDFDGKRVDDVLFFTRHSGIDLYVRGSGVSYVIRDVKSTFLDRVLHERGRALSKVPSFEREIKQDTMIWARVDLEIVDGKISEGRIEYSEPMSGYTNYYLAHCPEGVLFVPSYRVVRIREVYPGIDWVWRIGEDGVLHHEFEVRENGNVSRIKLEVKWADIKLSDDGKRLRLSTPVGEIEDGEIVGYDDRGKVKLSYVVDEGKFVSFKVEGGYKGRLTIDPPLARLWATYYGGIGDDVGTSITSDGSGNIFLTGLTSSTDFPTQNPGGGAYYQGSNAGNVDVFILKFTNSGVRLWATYYGGSDYDYVSSITTDGSDNIFLTGRTGSTNFPTYNPGGGAYYQRLAGLEDAFILKFTNLGVRLWATYYGGIGDDVGTSITSDGSGNIFLTGYTESADFPTHNPGGGAYYQGSYEAGGNVFILKFTNSGVRLWATYYGGNYEDIGSSITTDGSDNIFLTGITWSTNFPTYNPGGGAYYQGSNAGQYDIFILKFTNSGVRLWATYYGGSRDDFGYSITTDGSVNIFLTGCTFSTYFPTHNPGGGAYYQGSNACYEDIFIFKFTNSGVRLWATYYGGSNWDWGCSITTDGSGNIFLTGGTFSTDFPTHNPGGGAYYQGSNASYEDIFILKFTNSGVRLWATYYGGISLDLGNSITTDGSGNIFLAGYTESADFPTHNPGGGAYYQGSNAGGGDIFILKFSSSLPLISLSNNLVDFSYVYLGDERREYVIVKNAGGDTLRIRDIVIGDSSFAYLGSLPLSLGSGDSVSLEFKFKPVSSGFRVDTAFIYSNSEVDSVNKVVLRGGGVKPPYLSSSVDSINFRSVFIGDSVVKFLKLYNLGDFDTIRVISLEVSEPFRVISYLSVIKPGDSSSVVLSFKPTSMGVYDGLLRVVSTAWNDTLEVRLYGKGVPVVLNVDKRVQSGIVKFVCRFNASDSVRLNSFFYSIDGGSSWKLSSRVSSFAVVGVGVDTIYWDSRKDLVNFESADVKVRVDFIFGSFDFSIRIDSVGVDNLSPRFGGVKSHKNLLFGKVVLYWDRAVDISKVVYKVFIADSLISEVVTDSVFVSGLRTSTVYNFNVKVYDLVGNESSSPYSLKVNALCDYNGDNRVDAFDLGSYVKAWSELDYSGSDIYPYDGSLPQVVVRGDGKLDVYDVFTFTKIWDYSHIQGLPKVLSFSFEGVDVSVLVSGEEFVFKPDFRGKFLSYGVEVYHRGLVDSFEVLREGIGLVYRDSLGGVIYFDYSKFGGIEEGGLGLFRVKFGGVKFGDSVVIRFRGYDEDSLVSGREAFSRVYVIRFEDIPRDFALHQNYPNPFNPSTVIRFDLPRDVEVRLCVYDVLGRLVGVLVDGRVRAGRHSVEFRGDGLSSGVYFYRLEAGDFVSVKKMVLVK